MKLPSVHLAWVAQDKITGYLLHAAHRFGVSKARSFADFGFRVEERETLAAALREHGQRHEVPKVGETGFGPRYDVDGEVNAPDGRRPQVRTVWQMDRGHYSKNTALLCGKSERVNSGKATCGIFYAHWNAS